MMEKAFVLKFNGSLNRLMIVQEFLSIKNVVYLCCEVFEF